MALQHSVWMQNKIQILKLPKITHTYILSTEKVTLLISDHDVLQESHKSIPIGKIPHPLKCKLHLAREESKFYLRKPNCGCRRRVLSFCQNHLQELQEGQSGLPVAFPNLPL